MADLVRPDDLVLVNRSGADFQTEAKNLRKPISDHEPLPTPPWHGAAGIYHVIVTSSADILVTNQDKIYNLANQAEVESIHNEGEWIITGPNTQFKNSTGNWEFGDLTNTRDATNMSGMFDNARAFNVDISNWEVGNVTNMRQMFANARTFNMDISNWKVGNVTNMSYMFSYAKAFDQDISSWKVGNVTNMSGMFFNAVAFNSSVSNWDVGNVTSMVFMFNYAQLFNSDISNWNVGNVTNMRSMFQYAQAFNSDISNWNVGNVTNMRNMFYDAIVFNQDLSGWCVDPEPPHQYFDTNANAWTQPRPAWGTCP